MTVMTNPVAVVAVGSVSARLLITDGQERLRRTVDTVMGGSSMSSIGRLRSETIPDAALARVEVALSGFADLIAARDAGPARVIGTAAARLAANSEDLVGLVRGATGADLEVISPNTEARWSFLGAASGPGLSIDRPDEPVVTIDIGGYATAFAAGDCSGPRMSLSVPIGGALLRSAYLSGDPPRPEELSAALSVASLHLDDVDRELPQLGPLLQRATRNRPVAIAIGGATTIAAIEVGVADVDPGNGDGDGPLHGFELTRAAVEDVFRTIATENRTDRACNPGLPKARVDGIVGTCVMLVGTMRQMDLERVTVSQRGVMDGLAAQMLTNRTPGDQRSP